jgi:hypothetical protein
MTAQRIVIPSTAFSKVPSKQRKPRERNEQHLKFIRSLRCCICGDPNPDPAHIRAASPIHGKGDTGGGEKSSDKWTVPLCRMHHDEQHKAEERSELNGEKISAELTWWARKNIDPFGLALALFDASGDDEIADGILSAHLARRPALSSAERKA